MGGGAKKTARLIKVYKFHQTICKAPNLVQGLDPSQVSPNYPGSVRLGTFWSAELSPISCWNNRIILGRDSEEHLVLTPVTQEYATVPYS